MVPRYINGISDVAVTFFFETASDHRSSCVSLWGLKSRHGELLLVPDVGGYTEQKRFLFCFVLFST